jgi:microcystin-dependent protein
MSCGNSKSSKCNPCGPSEDAMNAIAERAAYYARIAQYAADQVLSLTGSIVPFAMDTQPNGWLKCDGSLINRVTYANLFNAIGITYGAGDGSTTFALPDLRGYFVRGFGTNSDTTTSGAFAVKQSDDIESHTHAAFGNTVTPAAVSISETFNTVSSGGMSNLSNISTSFSTSSLNLTVLPTGGTETRPKNIAMLYCIKT